MKIAITDACIFIDLLLLDLVEPFFNLELEVHTSLDVFYELNDHQRSLLSPFQENGRLIAHIIHHDDREAMRRFDFPRSLSEMDCTVLYLAFQMDAMVLSSDKVVRNYAKKKSIDYHGMLWILDALILQNCITTEMAGIKLRQLMSSNYIYQNNTVLLLEMNKRLKKWSEE